MRRIVVADDSALARQVVIQCLKIAGFKDYEFVEVADGLAALAALKAAPTDMLVTDLIMPNMDGWTLLQKVKEDPELKAVPVIVVASTGDALNIEKLRILGALTVIAKPANPAKLVAALKAAKEKIPPSPIRMDVSNGNDFLGIVDAAVQETLGGVSFLESNPASVLWAKIPLLKPLHGELCLIFPKVLVVKIAELLLRIKPEDQKEADLLDAVGELANTIAGQIMIRLGHGEKSTNLGLPTKGQGWPLGNKHPVLLQGYEVEGHLVCLAMCGDNIA